MAIDDAKADLVEAEAAVSSAMTDAAMAAAYRAIENAANALVAALTTHGGSSAEIAAAARTGGNAKAMADSLDMKIAEAQKAADMAMAATAAKLYTGIAAQDSTAGDVGAGTAAGDGLRAAAYNDAGVPSTVTPATTAATRIMVGIGTATPVALSEDKMAMVADNHGWAGKRYTASPDDDGMYEAMVYSNVGEPTMGKKFGGTAAQVTANEVQYPLTDGGYTVDGTTAANAPLVGGSSFDHAAGVKQFKLPSPNPNGATMVTVSGSFHGVSGTYSCTPGSGTTCAAQVAANGFTLGLRTDSSGAFAADSAAWVFKPSDPNARVTSTPDAIYASYGWWIHKSADGSTFTASAFADNKGAVSGATGLDTLQGTATYSGGAAGKYALSSSTGGTNDAGHFTAMATLEADFSDNSITGTVDNFMGADGMSRDWSVELKEGAIAATGGITRAADDDTAWTIGGTAASASGEWSGTLYDNGDDGVPKVGTGTFYTEYGMDGKMVGAFGVNKE